MEVQGVVWSGCEIRAREWRKCGRMIDLKSAGKFSKGVCRDVLKIIRVCWRVQGCVERVKRLMSFSK